MSMRLDANYNKLEEEDQKEIAEYFGRLFGNWGYGACAEIAELECKELTEESQKEKETELRRTFLQILTRMEIMLKDMYDEDEQWLAIKTAKEELKELIEKGYQIPGEE